MNPKTTQGQGKIEGKVGFEGVEQEKKVISKDETLFKVDKDGKAIAEICPIYVYDRELDRELIQESLLLMETIKRQKSIRNVLRGLKEKQALDIKKKEEEIKKEKDQKEKEKLENELNVLKNKVNLEEIKADISANIVDDGIKESREIIKELKEERDKQKVKKFIEMTPCTTSEAYQSFEKGKTIEGKGSIDWVADLISRMVTKPKYTFKDAKRLKPDYKIAIKEAIMEISNYKVTSYRDIMIEKKLEEEKPLTLKKG